jgi:hypothetical protein
MEREKGVQLGKGGRRGGSAGRGEWSCVDGRGDGSLKAKMLQVRRKKRRLRRSRSCVDHLQSCVFDHVGVTTCDGAGAGRRFELRPPVESSDLDEKVVLTTTPVRDTSSLVIWVESLTINVPVVYMGRYEVVLRGDYP